MKHRKKHMLGLLVFTSICASTQAISEQATDKGPQQSESAANAPAALSEVVVTAQKKTERLQDVPGSVSSIDTTVLAQQNAVQLQDYLSDVPGVSVGDLGSGRTQVVIRGISTGFGNNPTTGFTIDDVPFGASTSAGLGDALVPNLDPSDLDHVEVLRGPQGTLYGASSMGGLVKYVTAAPRLDAVSGQIEEDGTSVDRGSYGYGVRGFVNLPVLTDELGFRVSGFFRHDPGYIDDPGQGRYNVNDGETYGAHVTGLWHLLPTVDLRVTALFQTRSANASNTEDVTASGTPVYGDLTHERLLGTDGFDSRVKAYSATLTARLGGPTLTSITGYSQFSTEFPQDVSGDFTPFTPAIYGKSLPVRINNLYRTDKISQEVRLASADNHHFEWLVGAFYTREDNPLTESIFPVSSATGDSLPLQNLIDVDAAQIYQEIAGFADLTYYFSNNFDVTVGGRYSHNKQDYSELDTGALIGAPSSTLANSTDDSATFLVTPRYHFSDSLMAYARVASGYRPGGPNAGAVAGVPSSYGADKTVNYELGVKGDALERRFTYDADVFYIDWTQIQIREVDVDNGFSFYGNAGKANSRGVEMSARALAGPGLTLGGNFAYTDAYLTTAAPSGVYAPAGSRLPNSSKLSGSLSADEEVPLSDAVRGFGSLKIIYTGDRLAAFQTTETTPRFRLPGYTTIDFDLGAKTERLTASLFVRNLIDQRGFLDANAANSVTGVGAYYASIIQPRTVGFSIMNKF